MQVIPTLGSVPIHVRVYISLYIYAYTNISIHIHMCYKYLDHFPKVQNRPNT